MAFTPVAPKIPTSIGQINIKLIDNAQGMDEAFYEVFIKDLEGKVFDRKVGNLVPHLSAAQITGLQALVADIRVKAQALIS